MLLTEEWLHPVQVLKRALRLPTSPLLPWTPLSLNCFSPILYLSSLISCYPAHPHTLGNRSKLLPRWKVLFGLRWVGNWLSRDYERFSTWLLSFSKIRARKWCAELALCVVAWISANMGHGDSNLGGSGTSPNTWLFWFRVPFPLNILPILLCSPEGTKCGWK